MASATTMKTALVSSDILDVTLSLINEIFETNKKPKPFTAPTINSLHNATVNLGHKQKVGTSSSPSYQLTELYMTTKQIIDMKDFGKGRFESIMEQLYNIRIKKTERLRELGLTKALEFLNLDKDPKAPETVKPGEVLDLLAAAKAVSPEQVKEKAQSNDPSIAPSDLYNDENKSKDPVRAAIRVVKAILEVMYREYNVTPFQLARCVRGETTLPNDAVTFLDKLTRRVISTEDIHSSLALCNKWDASGIDVFTHSVIQICTFTLRTVFERIKRNFEEGQYLGDDLRSWALQCQEHQVIFNALSHYNHYSTIVMFLDAVEQRFPELKTCVSDILKLPADTMPSTIYETLLNEADHLKISAATDNIYATVDTNETIMRIDTGADSTIAKSKLLDKESVQHHNKQWGTIGQGQRFITTHKGHITGWVDNRSKPERHTNGEAVTKGSKKVQDKRVPWKVEAQGSTSCTENLLSTEQLVEDQKWNTLTLQLTKNGRGSYLYGTNGIRVPVVREEGKKGYFIKIYNDNCKSIISTREYCLIRVKTGLLRQKESIEGNHVDGMLVLVDNHIKFQPNYKPFDRSLYLTDIELDVYEQIENNCSCCTPRTTRGTLHKNVGKMSQIARQAIECLYTSSHTTTPAETIPDNSYREKLPLAQEKSKEYMCKQITTEDSNREKTPTEKLFLAQEKSKEYMSKQVSHSVQAENRFALLSDDSDEDEADNAGNLPIEEESLPPVVPLVIEDRFCLLSESSDDEYTTTLESKRPRECEGAQYDEIMDSRKSNLRDQGTQVNMDTTVHVFQKGLSMVKKHDLVQDCLNDIIERAIDGVQVVRSELLFQAQAPEEELIHRDSTVDDMKLRLSSTYWDRARHDYVGNSKVTLTDINEVFLLHEIHGHRSLSILREEFRIKIPRKYTAFACDACDAAKMTRNNSKPIYVRKGEIGRKCEPGEEWHLDLFFMPSKMSHRKGRIVSTRVDTATRHVDVSVLRTKSDALDSLKLFISRSARGKPKRIRVDRGMEYLNSAFIDYCRENGIELKPTGSCQHGQMGIAERFNRTAKEHVFASLLGRNVPLEYWPEALHNDMYIYNRSCHSGIRKGVPEELFTGHKVDSWNIKGVFGCKVKVLTNPDQKHRALKPRYRSGVYLGIDPHSSMGTYRVLMLDSKRIVHPSRHVMFDNMTPGFSTNTSNEESTEFRELQELLKAKVRNTPKELQSECDNGKPTLGDQNENNKETHCDEVLMDTASVDDLSMDQSSSNTETGNTNEEGDATIAATVPPVQDTEDTNNPYLSRLRDRSTINRPDYFSENREQIYAEPQLKPSSTTIGRVAEIAEEDPLCGIPMQCLYEARNEEETEGIYNVTEDGVEDPRQKRVFELRELVKRDFEKEGQCGAPPTNYSRLEQALSKFNPFRDKVVAAMELEILTLYLMGTFKVTPDAQLTIRERNEKRLRTKWVITVKETVFKARLVVLGYMQDTSGIYTYAPTLRKETIRQVFAKAAMQGTAVRSLDIRNAFIKELSNRELYIFKPHLMEQLLDQPFEGVTRIRLEKMLYGLAESPLVFYNGLSDHLEKGGFRRSFSDPCHFRKEGIDIGFHVDDGIYTGSNTAVEEFEAHMKEYYELKDVGVCRTFTGLRSIQTDDAVYVHQIPFIRKLVETYLDENVTYSRKIATPMVEKLRLEKPGPSSRTDPEAAHLPYKKLRCSLMWVACGTRPDISLATSVLGAYDHCYDRTLYKYLVRVLKYLEGSIYRCLRYSNTSATDEVTSYLSKWPKFEDSPQTGLSADASCLTRDTNYRGRGGYILMSQGGPITWSTHTLRGTSLGSYDAEFKNLSKACMEGARVQDSMVEFGLLQANDRLPVLNDCTTAIQAMERPPGSSKKCGHISKDYYYVQDKIKSRMKLGHLHTEYMIADILTKPLGPTKFKALRDKFLHELPEDRRGECEGFLVDSR